MDHSGLPDAPQLWALVRQLSDIVQQLVLQKHSWSSGGKMADPLTTGASDAAHLIDEHSRNIPADVLLNSNAQSHEDVLGTAPGVDSSLNPHVTGSASKLSEDTLVVDSFAKLPVQPPVAPRRQTWSDKAWRKWRLSKRHSCIHGGAVVAPHSSGVGDAPRAPCEGRQSVDTVPSYKHIAADCTPSQDPTVDELPDGQTQPTLGYVTPPSSPARAKLHCSGLSPLKLKRALSALEIKGFAHKHREPGEDDFVCVEPVATSDGGTLVDRVGGGLHPMPAEGTPAGSAQATLEQWNPFGSVEDDSDEHFQRRRQADLKHGRIIVLATTGYLLPELTGKLPGLTPTPVGQKSVVTADGPAVYCQVSVGQGAQIMAHVAFCEALRDRSPSMQAAADDFCPKPLTASDEVDNTIRVNVGTINDSLKMLAALAMVLQDVYPAEGTRATHGDDDVEAQHIRAQITFMCKAISDIKDIASDATKAAFHLEIRKMLLLLTVTGNRGESICPAHKVAF
mmetsp:Transcript_7687/g.16702  ORF Transcript_7687/g.16702 Transcript_7687/m.16702 type:complete len:508 (-) Transcript_7687:240-1763(-)